MTIPEPTQLFGDVTVMDNPHTLPRSLVTPIMHSGSPTDV